MYRRSRADENRLDHVNREFVSSAAVEGRLFREHFGRTGAILDLVKHVESRPGFERATALGRVDVETSVLFTDARDRDDVGRVDMTYDASR